MSCSMAFASATGHLAHLWKCFSTAGDFAALSPLYMLAFLVLLLLPTLLLSGLVKYY